MISLLLHSICTSEMGFDDDSVHHEHYDDQTKKKIELIICLLIKHDLINPLNSYIYPAG